MPETRGKHSQKFVMDRQTDRKYLPLKARRDNSIARCAIQVKSYMHL
jgi:hypothetical protein